MVDPVKAKREQILRLARRHGVTRVRVFGSMARGDAGPQSDVDLLIDVGRRLVGRDLDAGLLTVALDEVVNDRILVDEVSVPDEADRNVLAGRSLRRGRCRSTRRRGSKSSVSSARAPRSSAVSGSRHHSTARKHTRCCLRSMADLRASSTTLSRPSSRFPQLPAT